MWSRRRTLCAALALSFGLLGPCSSWASPTSPPSALPPGSVVLSAEDYAAIEGALEAAKTERQSNAETIKMLSGTVKSSSSVIERQSNALETSSKVIAEQARSLKMLSLACTVLGTAALLEGLGLLFK